jgi:hypothetical protein
MPKGVNAIKLFLLLGGLLAFVGLYGYFIVDIWGASGKKPPKIDKQLVYIASALGGVLGTFFAVALGVQRKDPATDASSLKLGPTLVGESKTVSDGLATAALWAYTIVGIVAAGTALIKTVQTPDAIKAVAATFGGYALAVFSAAFAPPQQQ